MSNVVDARKLGKILSGFNDTCWANFNDVIKSMDNPTWQREKYVHDWEAYIPEAVQEIWESLPIEARLIAYLMADEQASNEEWD